MTYWSGTKHEIIKGMLSRNMFHIFQQKLFKTESNREMEEIHIDIVKQIYLKQKIYFLMRKCLSKIYNYYLH